MRYFKIIYQNIDCREVWIESENDSITRDEIEELFFENYEKYDDESDEHDTDSGPVNILIIDEIDEHGEDLDGN